MRTIIMCIKENGDKIAGSAYDTYSCVRNFSRSVFQQFKWNNLSTLNHIYPRITKYSQTLVLFYHFELASNEIAVLKIVLTKQNHC